jgi:hypothetical protein
VSIKTWGLDWLPNLLDSYTHDYISPRIAHGNISVFLSDVCARDVFPWLDPSCGD